MAARPEDVHLAVSSAAGSVPPDDRAWFVYRACFFLGAGILFPWNSYITAVACTQYHGGTMDSKRPVCATMQSGTLP